VQVDGGLVDGDLGQRLDPLGRRRAHAVDATADMASTAARRPRTTATIPMILLL
jgi:hypothetical protein